MKKLLTLFAALAFVACTDDSGNKGGGNESDYDFERTAPHLAVHFYGDRFSSGSGTNNYYITFHESPLDNNWNFTEPGYTYQIDIYSNEHSLEKIPNGTYKLDIDDTCAAETISAYYSVYEEFDITNDYGILSEVLTLAFTEATLEVTDAAITLTATTEDGKTHKVTYSGDYTIIDDSEDSGSGDEGYGDWDTTLTDDVVVEYNDNYAYAEYYGDDYSMGYNVLALYFETEDLIGDLLQIEIAVENQDFAGVYSPCKNWYDAEVGNLITANMDEGYPYGGCWYWYSENGEYYDDYAPLVAGSLTITRNDTDYYTLSYEGYDEYGHKVSFDWTGEIELFDESQEYSAQQRISPLRREVKMLPMAARSQKPLAAKLRK